MLLPCPGARLEIVQTPDILPPVSFTSHFRELAVLNLELRANRVLDTTRNKKTNHHGMDDPKETFITWEEACPARQRVPLHHSLTGMLGENLNDTAAFRSSLWVPLKVTRGNVEDSAELITR